MRATKTILTFSFFLAISAQAETTFDLDLPDAAATHSSDKFVTSYENDSGRKKTQEVVTTYEEPKASPHNIPDEAPGGYSSAFTSYQSKKPSDDAVEVDPSEAWRKGQEKADTFNLDNLAEAPPEENRYFVAPKSISPYINVSTNIKAPNKAGRRAAGRSPASESVPLPEGIDLNKELEVLDAGGSEGSASHEAPVSAKDRKTMIMRTISENYRDLKTCYHEGLKKSSEMKGKVVMGWAMDPQGRVSGAEVQTSQLNNKSVEKCMVDRLSGWRFPRQAKLQGSKDRMTYTFQFVQEKD